MMIFQFLDFCSQRKLTNRVISAILVTSAFSNSAAIAAAITLPVAKETKVALLGDTGAGDDFSEVLKLTATEHADVIMINGDFGYHAAPEKWEARVRSALNLNQQAVIGALGNHDVEGDPRDYINIFSGFRNQNNRLNERCTGGTHLAKGKDIVAVDEVCTFGNVSIISNAIGQVLSSSYLEEQLEKQLSAAPAANWKLVGYHFTLASMNPGLKGDQNTFNFFDLIRKYGAIGAQAHTHTVMASCPIVSPFLRGAPVKCHPDFGRALDSRFVAPGVGLYVDSSLGGMRARSRKRCHHGNESGCEHMVDLVTKEGYTRTDGHIRSNFNRLGALFIVFNSGGDPTKAHAYYKSIDGQEIFNFRIAR